jgi:hypothetical protein
MIAPVSKVIFSKKVAFKPYTTESQFNVNVVTMLQPEVIERSVRRHNDEREKTVLRNLICQDDEEQLLKKRGRKPNLVKEQCMLEVVSQKSSNRAFDKKWGVRNGTRKRLLKL